MNERPAGDASHIVSDLRVGFGRTDITPLPGAEMPGQFEARRNTGIHDPLYASAIVLDDGQRSAAIVGVDCLSLKRSVVRAAREIARAGGYTGSLLACASHTHSGGPCADVFGSTSDPAYLAFLAGRIAQAVLEADRTRGPAQLGIGTGCAEGLAFNRRFRMRDGTTATHPGRGNAEIVAAAGPADPQVGVLGALDAGGRVLGAVVSFTCHCTVMDSLEVSADYPAWIDRTLRSALGDRAITVFVNGAFGDVTQVANTVAREPEFGPSWARRIGLAVGGEALKAFAALTPIDSPSVRTGCEEILLETRRPSREEIEAAKTLLSHDGPPGRDRWYAREIALLEALAENEPRLPAEIQAVEIGSAAFVGIPGELFCRYGVEIKTRSPYPHTFVAGLAGGCAGYLPDEEAFGPTGGGYEPRLCRSSRLAADSGRRITNVAIALLERLHHRASQR